MDATDTGRMDSSPPDSRDLKVEDLGHGFARISLRDIDPTDAVTADPADLTPTAPVFVVVGTGTTFIAQDMDLITTYIRDLTHRATRYEVVGRDTTDIDPVNFVSAEFCNITPEDSRSEAGMDTDINPMDSIATDFSEFTREVSISEAGIHITDLDPANTTTTDFSNLQPGDTILEAEKGVDDTDIEPVNAVTLDFGDPQPRDTVLEAERVEDTDVDPVNLFTADFGDLHLRDTTLEAEGTDKRNIDTANAVATAFGDLRTKESRLEALRELFNKLNSSEIKELSRWCHDRDYRYDILGNLPLELVPHVLRYVDLRTAFRCRRISQRWALIISLEYLSRTYIQPWYSRKDLPLRDHQSLPLSTESTEISKMAGHIDAFCTGRPFASLTMFLDHPHSSDFRWRFRYCCSFLTWWDDKSRLLHLVDLKGGSYQSYELASTCYVITESLIVFCSEFGTVKVINHLTGAIHRFRLPSGDIKDMVAKGGAIAILHEDLVITWHFETDKTCQFCVYHPNPQSPLPMIDYGIYLTTEDLNVIYFEVYENMEGESAELSLTRYVLDGTPLTSAVRVVTDWYGHSKPAISTTGLDGKALQNMLDTVAWPELRDDSRRKKAHSIVRDDSYGSAAACLWNGMLYESRDISSNGLPHVPRLGTTVYDIQSGTVKTIVFCPGDIRCNTAKTMVCPPDAPTVRYNQAGSDLHEPNSHHSSAGYLKGPFITVMGDENFVVNISDDGMVVVYCFDKEANLGNLAKTCVGIDFQYTEWR